MINVELICDRCDRMVRDEITDSEWGALGSVIGAAGWRWVEIEPEGIGLDVELLCGDCDAAVQRELA
jgi:hypothetical protein